MHIFRIFTFQLPLMFNVHLNLIRKNMNNLITLLNVIFSKSKNEYSFFILYIIHF